MTASPQVAFRLPAKTRMGPVALAVADLAAMTAFYTRALGLQVRRQTPEGVWLGVEDADLLLLSPKPHGRPVRGHTGLYHFALVVPDRGALAQVVARLFAYGVPNAPTDHIMTKATYLNDPEGNGIEVYCESPEDGEFVVDGQRFYARRADGTLSDGREPLDLEALFAHLPPGDPRTASLPPGTRMGHVHLHVHDLEAARRFYCNTLGFDDRGLMRAFRMGMASVGGYHHHIGYNTWQGEDAPPPPPDALGLLWFSLLLPNAGALAALAQHLAEQGVPYYEAEGALWVRDPSHNTLRIFAPGGKA